MEAAPCLHCCLSESIELYEKNFNLELSVEDILTALTMMIADVMTSNPPIDFDKITEYIQDRIDVLDEMEENNDHRRH